MTALVPGVAGLLFAIVITAAVYDIRFRRIPNWLTLTGVILGFALNAFLADRPLAGLKHSGMGMALGFGVYFILYLIHAMGAGDTKLMAAVGAIVGPRAWFSIFIVTALIGGVFALALLLTRGRLRKTFWNVGYLVTELAHGHAPFMSREELDVKSPKAVTLPHGFTICIGCLVFYTVGFFVK
jgi:prepilin peptidase CpaA